MNLKTTKKIVFSLTKLRDHVVKLKRKQIYSISNGLKIKEKLEMKTNSPPNH